MKKSAKRERLGTLATQIEEEMRRLSLWLERPPSEQSVVGGGAFGQGSVGFDTWLQVVFITRLHQVAAGTFDLPKSSSVGARAVREWDGDPMDRRVLLGLIEEVDDLLR